MRVLDRLSLTPALALLIVEVDGVLRPEPWVLGAERRAAAGDGAAEALTAMLAEGSRHHGRFTLTSWHHQAAHGERGFGVDQTNDSVIVGEQAVVKWFRATEPGPHPAPRMLEVLQRQGFTGMPRPWGLLEWQAPGESIPRLLATVDTLLPDAVDGWTWAVEDLRAAVTSGSRDVLERDAEQLGRLVAAMHAALADTGRPATAEDVEGWRTGAQGDLDAALGSTSGPAHELLAERADTIRRLVTPPAGLVGTPLLLTHGDLHVGQILRSADIWAVTDFDGNPVASPGERTTPQPAAVDVAGMVQSLAHVVHVVRKHHADLDPGAVREAGRELAETFLATYERRLEQLGRAELLEPALLPGLRLRQVCREFTYAARHLPRWSYVPEAALVDLIPTTERT